MRFRHEFCFYPRQGVVGWVVEGTVISSGASFGAGGIAASAVAMKIGKRGPATARIDRRMGHLEMGTEVAGLNWHWFRARAGRLPLFLVRLAVRGLVAHDLLRRGGLRKFTVGQCVDVAVAFRFFVSSLRRWDKSVRIVVVRGPPI